MAEEADVGILCYTTDVPGFRGILKHRYTDFIVNEVDCEGNVVRLTCLDAPDKEVKASQMAVVKEVDNEKCTEQSDGLGNELYSEQIQAFERLVSEADAEKLKVLLGRISAKDFDNIEPIVLTSDSDKAHRGEVHNFFKANLGFLVTDTIDGPETQTKCVRIRYFGKNTEQGQSRGHGRSGDRKRKNHKEKFNKNAKKGKYHNDQLGDQAFDSRGADDWQEGKFLRFHLYKENKDTQEALNVIGKMLGLRPKAFGIAGTKDKRAVTTQRVTVFKQRASRLASLNPRLYGIKLGDFCYVNSGLVLGQLSGNRFTITLRGVAAENEHIIKEAADGLGKNGFVNYFGLQRFGSGSVGTHAIGAALLRGEWKTAIDLILDPRDGEREDVREAREYYRSSNDIDGTLRRMPRHLIAEKAILTGLKKDPSNHIQALSCIPRNLRLMYVHSYQSYLWNHASTARLQKYGAKSIAVGDLVYCKRPEVTSTQGEVQNIETSEENAENDLETLYESTDSEVFQDNNTEVKVVNSDDIESGKYAMEDVVLPLPGSKILYPENDIAQVFHDMAKKDSLSLIESSHHVKEFSIMSISGGYRRLVQKPIDFTWKIMKYEDPGETLAETDHDLLQKCLKEDNAPLETPSGITMLHDKDADACSLATTDVKCSDKDNSEPSTDTVCSSHIALQLAFTLPTSCYATMAIRELLKTSTSTQYHKSLDN